jgi:hypothetical protein
VDGRPILEQIRTSPVRFTGPRPTTRTAVPDSNPGVRRRTSASSFTLVSAALTGAAALPGSLSGSPISSRLCPCPIGQPNEHTKSRLIESKLFLKNRYLSVDGDSDASSVLYHDPRQFSAALPVTRTDEGATNVGVRLGMDSWPAKPKFVQEPGRRHRRRPSRGTVRFHGGGIRGPSRMKRDRQASTDESMSPSIWTNR